MESDSDLDALLDQVLRLPREARQAFLDAHCASDDRLRGGLEELLREHDDEDPILKPGGAFDGPLWEELLTEQGELAAGARLGPYQVRGSLGAGGMGEVYRAHDTRLSRDVAIKILPALSGGLDALARFEREARAVAALSHPNILAIHDVGAEGSTHFVVTELLEGETLRVRLAARGPLAPSEASAYGVQIARGLAAAHDRGIVHRDLKPDNIFVTRDGRVKILDFGIAAFDQGTTPTGPQTTLTKTGQVLGTLGYMAPEQLLGHPAIPQSDLFAFGIVMHEMLTGSHPFARTTAPEVQTAILREEAASLARAVPGLAPSLVRVIERCLEKEPAQRPESARDLAIFLEALSDTSAPAVHRVEPLRRLPLPLMIMSGGLLLLTLAAWAYLRVSTERIAREAAGSELVRAERMAKYIHDEQRARVALVALMFASFPELKAAFATDFATIRDFLLQYQQRIPGQPLLVAIGPDGTVLARTDESTPQQAARRDQWLDVVLSAPGDAHVVAIANRPSVAVAVALEAAGTSFGYLVAAEPLDQRFAQAVSEATQDGIVMLSDGAVLATTLRSGQNPWPSLNAWRASGGGAGVPIETHIGTEPYFAREVPLATSPAVSVIILRSRDEAFGSYDRVKTAGLVALLVVVVAAIWGALTIVKRQL